MKHKSKQDLEQERKDLRVRRSVLTRYIVLDNDAKKKESQKIMSAKAQARVLKERIAARNKELNDVDSHIREIDGKLADIEAHTVKVAGLAVSYGVVDEGDVFVKGAFSNSIHQVRGGRAAGKTWQGYIDWSHALKWEPNDIEALEDLYGDNPFSHYFDAMRESVRRALDPESLTFKHFEKTTGLTGENLQKHLRYQFGKEPRPTTKAESLFASYGIDLATGQDESVVGFWDKFGRLIYHPDDMKLEQVAEKDGVYTIRITNIPRPAKKSEQERWKEMLATRESLYREGLGIIEKLALTHRQEVQEGLKERNAPSLTYLYHKAGFAELSEFVQFLRNLETKAAKEQREKEETCKTHFGNIVMSFSPMGTKAVVRYKDKKYTLSLEVRRKMYTKNDLELHGLLKYPNGVNCYSFEAPLSEGTRNFIVKHLNMEARNSVTHLINLVEIRHIVLRHIRRA